MRKSIQLSAVILSLVLKSIAYGQGAPEGMGFHDSLDAAIPGPVQEASKSAFRLVVPAGEKVSVEKIFKGKNAEQAISYINGLDQSKISKYDRVVFLYQLEQCLKSSSHPCLVYEGVEKGTGFVVGDGTRMYTAYHVVASVASMTYLPFFIFDSNEALIYSPENTPLQLVKFGSTKNIAGIDPNIQKKLDDVATLQAPFKIAKPINASSKNAEVGAKVYITGFPMQTSDRLNYGAQDSNGTSQHTTFGHRMSFEEIKSVADKKFGGASTKLLTEMAEHLITSSADGAPGLSGGPTLNEKGEYLGVFTSGAPQFGAEVERLSFSTPVILYPTDSASSAV